MSAPGPKRLLGMVVVVTGPLLGIQHLEPWAAPGSSTRWPCWWSSCRRTKRLDGKVAFVPEENECARSAGSVRSGSAAQATSVRGVLR
ncbi:hypothetical protein LV779_16035 [Streptomyces thinghirensis]|nr:hypothetical protein [Streptomyces thinghirensis]